MNFLAYPAFLYSAIAIPETARERLANLHATVVEAQRLGEAAKAARWERVRRRWQFKGETPAEYRCGCFTRRVGPAWVTTRCPRHTAENGGKNSAPMWISDEECIRRAWLRSRVRYIARVATIDTRDLP